MTFEEFQAKRAAERAAAPARVTWRKVSALTGGGWSGLGPGGKLVWVRAYPDGSFEYGRMADPPLRGDVRVSVGGASTLKEAKERAAALLSP